MNIQDIIWPALQIAAPILIMYFGKVFAIEKEVERHKLKIESLEKRSDSHSSKIDKILNGVTEIKESLVELKTELKHKEDKQ